MKKIAIIGGGVSGLACAHWLSDQYAVELFEANDYLGGHTATIDVQHGGQTWAIDTGFIVFNDRTYPRFQGLLDKLQVPYQPTEMSFSVTHERSGLIYNGHSLFSLFAQKSNVFKPRFWRFLKEIIRFNTRCKQLIQDNLLTPEKTVGEFLQEERFSDYFAEHYILPMGAAIWSASLGEIQTFPLRFFVQFFENHGLLNVQDRPQWYSIKGGSKAYIPYLIAGISEQLHTSTPVRCVRRSSDGVALEFADGTRRSFDEVIFACHSDQALSLLESPSDQENAILGAIPYRENEVVLHSDARLLPPLKAAHASWNYHLSGIHNQPASVTYSMNILQCLPAGAPPFCVTLNKTQAIDPDKIHGQYCYSHPVFSTCMVSAQNQREKICGVGHTHFCGAYWYNGFHEDGVRSALEVCKRLGVQV